MKLVLAVAIGGALGALARYHSVGLFSRLFGAGFPFGTLFVNVLGSFLMGIVVQFFIARANVDPSMRAFIMAGLLGGFTTFSSFALDVSMLAERGALLLSGGYVVLSVVLSIAGLFFGIGLARIMFA